MVVINEIDYALAHHASYEYKVSLFAKYGNNAALLKTFQSRKDRQIKEALDYQLRRLRWKPGVTLVNRNVEKSPGRFYERGFASQPIIDKLSDKAQEIAEEQLRPAYPPEIAKAIQERQKAVNQREAAGRKLTQDANTLTKRQRSDLIRIQRENHQVVVQKSAIIKEWRENGTLPSPTPLIEEIPEEDRENMEAEWTESLRSLSRAKKSIELWTKRDNETRILHFKDKYNQLDRRLDELAELLGKKRRK